MTTAELRERMIIKRTQYESSLKESEKACKNMKEILGSITKEHRDLAISLGINLDELVNVDYDKIRTDEDYINEYKKNLDAATSILLGYVEKALAE